MQALGVRVRGWPEAREGRETGGGVSALLDFVWCIQTEWSGISSITSGSQHQLGQKKRAPNSPSVRQVSLLEEASQALCLMWQQCRLVVIANLRQTGASKLQSATSVGSCANQAFKHLSGFFSRMSVLGCWGTWLCDKKSSSSRSGQATSAAHPCLKNVKPADPGARKESKHRRPRAHLGRRTLVLQLETTPGNVIIFGPPSLSITTEVWPSPMQEKGFAWRLRLDCQITRLSRRDSHVT